MNKKMPLGAVWALLALSLAVGCAPAAAPDSTPADSGASAPIAPSSEPVEITAVLQINPEIQLENNPVIEAIEKKLNIKLIIEAPPLNSYGDRVKMLVATGDMPDLVHYGADIFATQWAEEGLLMDVTDALVNYPNITSNITKEQMGDCAVLDDGRFYGIPRPNSYDKWGYIINQKWLDNLGLKPPKTVEEFTEVCRQFTRNDPDGNGKADTYGASLHANQSSLNSGIWHLQNDFLSMPYSISSWHAGMPDADGGARIRALKAEYKDYIQTVRALYEEGIIDREFVTHKGEENIEKLAQQRVGIIGASEGAYISNIIEKYSLNLDDFVYCAPLVKASGDKPVYAMPPSNWMAYYLNAKSSPEKQDAVLRLLDYANSEEGFVLMQMGIAGTHYHSYDVEARTVERTDEQYDARMKVTSNMLGFANAYQGKPPLQGGSSPEAIAKWQAETALSDKASRKCYFGFTKMLDLIGVEFPDETQTLNSLEVRYITGEVSLDKLMSYVNGEYKTKTAAIAKEFADYMAANPARYED